jgi:hypothetical protein
MLLGQYYLVIEKAKGGLFMHRVPLGTAIFILIILFFCAISYNTEGLWTAFGINLVLVIIGGVRAYIKYDEYKQEQYGRRDINSNYTNNKNSTGLSHLGENFDPDAIFVYALIKFQEAKTEKEREHSYRLIADAAYKGSEKAQKFLEELTM